MARRGRTRLGNLLTCLRAGSFWVLLLASGLCAEASEVSSDVDVPVVGSELGDVAARLAGGKSATQALLDGVLSIREPANQIRQFVFEPMAFLILVGVLIGGIRRSETGKDLIWAVATPVILAVFVSQGMQMVSLTRDIFDQSARLGVRVSEIDYRDLPQTFRNFASIFGNDSDAHLEDLERQRDAVAAAMADQELTEEERMAYGNLVEAANATQTSGKSSFSAWEMGKLFNWLVGVIFCGLVMVIGWVTGFIMDVMLIMRLFLLIVGQTLLPVFIAGLGTQVFRTQGVNYCFGLMAICAWPLGWLLGHLGTVALFDWTVTATMNAIGLTDIAVLGVGKLSADVATEGARVLASKLSVLSWGLLLLSLVGILVLAIWAIMVTISVPVIVGKVMQGGSQFATGLVGGVSQASAGAVGGALSVGMIGATGAASILQAKMAAAGGGGAMGGGGGVGTPSGGGAGSIRIPGPPKEDASASKHSPGSGEASGSSGSAGSNPGDIANSVTGNSSGGNAAGSGGGGENGAGGGGSGGNGGGSRGGGSSGGGGGSPGRAAKAFARSGANFAMDTLSRGGFAVANTLSNASRWNGDPMGIGAVPDHGFDECREHRMQQEIRDLSQEMASTQARRSARGL